MRAIAETGALATRLGLDTARTHEIISGLANLGLEVDDGGNVIGCALSSTPSPHAIRIGKRELFAWCALDTLFIPGLVGQACDVESNCAASGETVRLRVSPGGTCDFTPSSAVLSVFLPGMSGLQTGPAIPT